MNEEMKLNPKTKINPTKYKINMICQDEQGIDQCMTGVAKVCARGGDMQYMTNA